MQVAVSMLLGLSVGVVLYLLTRGRGAVAMRLAIVLGISGSALLLGSINGWLLPDLGRFGASAIGMFSGIASALALGCILGGDAPAAQLSGPPRLRTAGAVLDRLRSC